MGVEVSASRRSGAADAIPPDGPGPDRAGPREQRGPGEQDAAGPADGAGADLLAALLDGMDAALCAFDAHGTVTHWNREAERMLGYTSERPDGASGP